MLTVKTRIGPSAIEGMGLFAAEDIKAGTVTWRFVSGFDRFFSADEIAALPEPARTDLINHTYVDAATGRHVLCLDNARFMNHADNPNTRGVHSDGTIEGYDIATRDIARGEELTCDYRQFDAAFKEKLGADDNSSREAL
jgi:SET domain-containing protein